MRIARPQAPRNLVTDLRGATRLAVDATTGMTSLVEAMHANIASAPTALGGPVVGGVIGGITRLVYQGIRGVTRAVGGGIDVALGRLAPTLGHVAGSPERDALIAALNGVLGDQLAESGNPLAVSMHFRFDGKPLELAADGLVANPAASRRIVVLAHGLCVDDLGWNRKNQDHGAALARDLGYTPVYLRYNTGLHISTNGRALAAEIEALVACWPVPIEDLVIVAHSMGGLVARSAHHYATLAGHAWPSKLRKIVFLATPHHGAPLEKGGHGLHLLLESTRYTAPFTRLARIRSAGITDLRHGWLLDEDWNGHDRFARRGDPRRPVPLPHDVQCYAVAATVGGSHAHAGGRLIGDGLVRVPSALGQHRDPRFRLAFPATHQWIARRTGHFGLLGSPAVYDRIRNWLAE